MQRSERNELLSKGNPNILRVIPSWKEYFFQHADTLASDCVVTAQGGTIDSVRNHLNKLTPIPHSVDIPTTRGQKASDIARSFTTQSVSAETLGALYPWTLIQVAQIPWIESKVRSASRISSFDSAQERNRHFVASIVYDNNALEIINNILRSQGTDTLVDKATLEAIILSQKLVSSGKKIVIAGAAESGYEENSDAISNITSGIYVMLEKLLPGGVYTISSTITNEGEIITQVLPGLGSAKLRADGKIYAPNSGPILTIQNGIVFIHPLYTAMKNRFSYFSLLPNFSDIYLQNSTTINRLQEALDTVASETVVNDPSILDRHYEDGKRAFVIKAKGAGNADDEWKTKIADIIARKDTTVIVITNADSGDVNLEKYAAGLYSPGVLSGRTLREEAARVLAGIIQDLSIHDQLSIHPQKLIELFCYISGMIELPYTDTTQANFVLE